MSSEEKLCPYCAETIKVAAIKCRYCQSDLTRAVPAAAHARGTASTAQAADDLPPPPEQARTEPPSAPARPASGSQPGVEEDYLEPGPGSEGISATSVRQFVRGPIATVVLAVAVLALALGCFLVWQVGGNDGTGPDGQVVVSNDARSVALSEATDLTEKTLSYNYKDFDIIQKRNTARMSAAFQKQYDATMEKVAARTKKYKVILDAKVVASGIVDMTAQRARVLVFVNQTTQALAQPSRKPTIDLNRVLVTIVRSGGDWRIDKLDPLAGG